MRLPRGGVVRVGLAVAAGGAAVAVGVGLLLSAILNSRDTADATLRSDTLLQRVIVVEQSVVDAETGLRGYVITGANVFLAPLENAKRVLPAQVHALDDAARADNEFVDSARLLGTKALAYLADYVPSVLRLLPQRHAAASSLSVTLQGKRLVDAVRVQTAVLQSAIARQESDRQHDAHTTANDAVEEAVIVLALLVALAIIVGAVVGRLVLSRERARARAEFRAAASRRLDESLSIGSVLAAGAELLAGRFADACLIADSNSEAALRAERGDRGLLEEVDSDQTAAAALRAAAAAGASRASAAEALALPGAVIGLAVAGVAHGRQTIEILLLCRAGRQWRSDEVEDIVELSTRIALAAQLRQLQARTLELYERSNRTAHTLQESLLPRTTPEIPLCDVAVRFSPAGEGDLVGGDFYDVFAVSAPHEWAVMIGDVCGKGAQAAAMTAMARWTLRAQPDEPPAAALRRLNQAMLRRDLESTFITVAVMHLRVEEDHAVVAVACGGHPAPIHVRRGGTASAIDAGGDLIGIWPDLRLRTAEVRLEPGELLVAFTDGATDFTPEPLERLEDLLSHLPSASAADAASAVERHALDGVAASRDDIAVVAIGFAGRRGAALTPSRSLLAASR
ncbi:MAG TPA: SpoIIE family protein phosphatase [Solirubrobacteraceae bacterium]|jgi:serine phosphatase RsbU (regulator of sigma subunit)/CHASE3 domain sensor protein|nr:SpoIIE family protein phosphatase [Solirubrobacteraceae bacterium]